MSDAIILSPRTLAEPERAIPSDAALPKLAEVDRRQREIAAEAQRLAAERAEAVLQQQTLLDLIRLRDEAQRQLDRGEAELAGNAERIEALAREASAHFPGGYLHDHGLAWVSLEYLRIHGPKWLAELRSTVEKANHDIEEFWMVFHPQRDAGQPGFGKRSTHRRTAARPAAERNFS